MKESRQQTKFANVGMALIRRKLLVLLCLVVVVGVGGYGLSSLTVSNALESFLPDDSPTLAANEAFEEIFGQRDIVFILVESDNVFSYSTLDYLDRVTRDLEAHLPFATEVVSLANIPYIQVVDDMLVIEDLIPGTIPNDLELLAEVRNNVMSRPSLAEMLVTADEKATGIFVILDDMPSVVYAEVPSGFTPTDQLQWEAEDVLMRADIFYQAAPGLTEIDNPPNLLVPPIEVILERHAVPGISAIPAGMHVMDFYGDAMLFETAGLLVLVTLAISTLLMVLLTRGIRPVIGTFCVIVMTLVVLLGIFGWMGNTMNFVSAAVPLVLVMVLAVGYSIHVVNHFKTGLEEGRSRLEAVRYAYAEATWPVFISAATSALGFLSFTLVPLPPIRVVGIACALASLLTYVMVMIVLPLSLSLGRDEVLYKGSRGQKPQGFQGAMVNWANFVSGRPGAILVIAAVFMMVFGYYSTSLRTNPDMMEMGGDKADFIRDARYVIDRLGALYTYDVFIELPEMDMARTSAVLQGVEALQSEIGDMVGTVNTGSMVNLLREMNMIMNDNNIEYFRVPDSDQLAAQYLLLYEMAGGDGLDSHVDFDYQRMRINVQINQFSGELFEAFEQIESSALRMLPPGTQVSIVGHIPLLLESTDLLTSGNVRSLLTAILVITLVMVLVLKSVKLGLLSMIPNALPILAALGFMGIMDIALDFFTVMVTPMILGIAVDDTVHYFVHFKEEFDRSNCYVDANRENFRKIGRALISTTVILVAGFAALTMIPLAGFQNMALVAAVGISVALLGDMLVAPALTVGLKPFGREYAPVKSMNIQEEAK